RAVARRAAGAGGVAENLRGVVAGQLWPARRFTERSTARADGDPRIIRDHDVLDGDDEGVAALGAIQVDGAANGVGVGRKAVEAGAQSRDGLGGRSLEIAGARVPGFDLEALAGPDAQQRLVAPVEGVLAGQVTPDALHSGDLIGSRCGRDDTNVICGKAETI